MAVSLAVDFRNPRPESALHYQTAARTAVNVLRSMSAMTIPQHTLLNLNVPDVALAKVRGVKLARQGFRYYSGGILRRKDHRGRDYYWVGGHYKGYRKDDGSDCAAVEKGYAALRR